jgi:hypothetical protein
MDKKKRKENFEELKKNHNDHKLTTRREFLAHGLISGAGMAFAPSLLSFLYSRKAYGQDCAVAAMGATGKTPVIIFDMAGGANIAGSNVMAGGQGGQLDFIADYSSLGLPMEMHPSRAGQVNTELGLAFHSDSGYLRGIRATTSAGTRAKIDGGIFNNVSNDDTGNNPHNPAFWLNAAGAMGELAQIAGTRDSVSGGRSIAPNPSVDASRMPVQITNQNDAMGLVTLGRLNNLFPDDNKVRRVLETIQNMSESRMLAFSRQSVPEQIQQLVSCGYIQTNEFISKYDANALDPNQDADVTATFNDLGNNDQRKTATIAKMLLDGYIGVGTVELGGRDYHGDTRSRGEQRDLEAGQLMGRVMELAARKGKDLVMYVITDGGVAARGGIDNSAEGRGKLIWTSDNGQRSSTFMMVYKDAGRPTVRSQGRQIGYMRTNGSVEAGANLIANSVPNLAKAIVANYSSITRRRGTLRRSCWR